MKPSSYTIKVAVLGEWATGKTSLIERMVHGKWNIHQSSTIGCAFYSLRKKTKYGIPVAYQIWDTAGQERYRAMTSLYYRNSDIIIICFDLSDIKSFRSVDYWVNEVRENDYRQDRIIYLVANKSDLSWAVSQSQLDTLAKKLNLRLVVTSALENRGIIQFLDRMTGDAEIAWHHEILHRSESSSVTIREPKPSNFDKCCIIS